MNKWITFIILIAAFGFLSLLDIGLNLVSLIPAVGDIFESLSEMVLETIQIIFFAIMAFLAVAQNE